MDTSFVRILTVLGGIFVGLQVWSRSVRWVHSVWLAAKSRGDNANSVSLDLPMVLFLHSGPWLLAAFVAFTVYIFSTPHQSGWVWFFGGVFVTPLLIGLNVLWYFQRKRKAEQLRRVQP
jgi:hypothetical protein